MPEMYILWYASLMSDSNESIESLISRAAWPHKWIAKSGSPFTLQLSAVYHSGSAVFKSGNAKIDVSNRQGVNGVAFFIIPIKLNF